MELGVGEGWKLMVTASGGGPSDRTCFFVAPIGTEGSTARKRSDYLYEFLIEPCAKELQLIPVRADKMDTSGFITSQIVSALLDAAIVVADFWELNANVFYELAIRHAFGKPVIHLYHESIPFDVSAMRAIPLDHQDLRQFHHAKRAVLAQMRAALEPTFVQWSPISVALHVERLQNSGSNLEAMIARLVEDVEYLKAKQQQSSSRTASSQTGSSSSETFAIDSERVQELREKLNGLDDEGFAISFRFIDEGAVTMAELWGPGDVAGLLFSLRRHYSLGPVSR